MKQMINKNTALKILLLSAVIGFVFYTKKQNRQNELIKKELIKQFSKILIRKEIETRKMIYTIEQKIKTVENSDKEIQKRIETSNNNYKAIIRNLNKINNEKIKTDLEIINADDSSDWNWFNRRFPKSENNNKLSVETDTIVGKSGKDRQNKSNGIKQSR